MANGVDAIVHSVQTPCADSPVDFFLRPSLIEQLRSAHHPELTSRQLRKAPVVSASP